MAAEGTSERVSTGIEPLDRELGGGVFPGSIVALTAPPASQSEPILHAAMGERPTLYLTTRRTKAAVEADLRRSLAGAAYEVVAARDDPIETARDSIADVADGWNVVVDPTDPLARADDPSQYVEFLNDFKAHLAETGGVGLLHCETGADTPTARSVTLGVADVVWELSVEVKGTDLENRLAVPKFRGNDILEETIKLELGDGVRVDTSRDIA